MAIDTSIQKRIILADDHEIVRAGLRRLLSIDKSIIILDEARNGAEAIELVKYHKPDIALLDILMPKMSGIEAAKQIRKEVPDTLIVILTAFEDSTHVERALEAGANAYLAKDISAKDLVEALEGVFEGERVFSKSILKILEKRFEPTKEEDAKSVQISKREQEILNYVAMGKTSSEIADELFISVRTVQSHRSNIMQKLGIKNAAGLIRYAVYNYE
jgi:DNA-binding NarL/FixJ family response regulator